MPVKKYHFKSFLSELKGGGIVHTIVTIPQQTIDEINTKGRIRTKGTFNNLAEFALAIQPLKTGEKYFSVNADLRKKAKVKLGDAVDVEFWIVDADIVDYPEELLIAMEQDELGKKIFTSMNKGAQRGLAHYINSAKNIDVRINRALSILERAKNGEWKHHIKKLV